MAAQEPGAEVGGEYLPGRADPVGQPSGHAAGADAWWIWVEGMKNQTACNLNFSS